jgi:GNAT superfamily N-acetyltransferase
MVGHVGLRRGEPSDLSFIYRLERRYIEELESDQLARWQDSIERHIDQWVTNLPRTTIAQMQGTPVGYFFWERQDEKATLASISVEPSYRRRGIASTLLERFEDEARLTGCSLATLGSVIHNPARQLYEGRGYWTTGMQGRYVLMTKRL